MGPEKVGKLRSLAPRSGRRHAGLRQLFGHQAESRLGLEAIAAGQAGRSLDKGSCQGSDDAVLEIETIDDPAAVAALMDPLRTRILSELTEPRSAAALAQRVGLTRQKVNDHLRALEKHGLAHEAERRQWGGITERRLVATAASFVVSPDALGPVASDPARTADRLSAGHLIALVARAVREVGRLVRRARAEKNVSPPCLSTPKLDLPRRPIARPSPRNSAKRSRISFPVTTNLLRRTAAYIDWSSSPIRSKKDHEHEQERQGPASRGNPG